MKPGLHQLTQSGAADGDVATWDAASGLWVPAAPSASAGVQSVNSGTDITVDNADPQNPVINYTGSGGGGGGTTMPLDPGSLHATYGDHFTGASLDAKWTRVTYTSGDEQYQAGAGSLLLISARTSGCYYYQTAPAGDFSVVAKFSVDDAGSTHMFGPLIMDATGKGVGGGYYTAAPNAMAVGTLTAGAYNSASFLSGTVKGTDLIAATQFWVKLTKSGTNYTTRVSKNGQFWSKPTTALSAVSGNAFTPARIGFGVWYNGGTLPGQFAIDFFDVQ